MKTEYNFSYDFDYTDWDQIESFDDAIKLNIEFLEGKRKSTPYHGAPVYDVDMSKLIYIHKNGRIITINGQSNECEYDKLYPKKRMVYLLNDIITDSQVIEERTVSFEQKSYLEGFIEEKQLRSFLGFLRKQKSKVAYHLYDIDRNISYYNEFKKRNMWLTRHKLNGSDWVQTTFAHKEPELDSLYNNILIRSMTPLVYFLIYSIEPCGLNMEDILVMYINQRGQRRKKKASKKASKKKASKKKASKKASKKPRPTKVIRRRSRDRI